MKRPLLLVLAATLVTSLVTAHAQTKPVTPKTKQKDLQTMSLELAADYAEKNAQYLQTRSEQNLIDASMEATRNLLKDPLSAQFRKVRLVPYGKGRVVCGEINGKNAYGGYVGFKSFVASHYEALIQSTGSRYPEIDGQANAGLVAACGA